MDEMRLKQFLADYADAWRINTVAALSPFWDADRFRFYKAEEIEQVHHRWEDVVGYWRMNEGMIGNADVSFADPYLSTLDAGWSVAVVKMRWNLRFTPVAPAGLAGRAMGGHNHVTSLFHDDRLVGWSEAPDAPLIYMGRLYEDQARGV